MTQAGIEKTPNFAWLDRLEREPDLTVENFPDDRGKIPIWRLDLEPRHLIAERRAYVSAIAYGGE